MTGKNITYTSAKFNLVLNILIGIKKTLSEVDTKTIEN
jgi:hypothetical protein